MPDSNTKLLLHFNKGGSPHTVTTVGNAQLDTTQKKFGTASLLLDGTGDYLTVPDHTSWYFGGENFTIDCWVRFSSVANAVFVSHGDATSNSYWWFGFETANGLGFTSENGSATITVKRAWSPSADTWYHVAMIRTSSTFRLFVDGTQLGSDGTDSDLIANPTTVLYVGSLSNSTYQLNGWLDELRISKSIARWTNNFTAPTSAHTSDSYTKLLLHFDGADAATSIIDSSSGKGSRSHIITANGNAQIDTAQYKFGSSSGLFDGTGDSLSIPDHSDWTFFNNDFTIDLWIRFNSVASNQMLVSHQTDGSNYWQFEWITSNQLRFLVNEVSSGISITVANAWTPSINTWYHVSVVRTGNTFKMFVDGTQIGSDATDTEPVPNFSGSLYIGIIGHDSSEPFNGWMDELRISDTARWTASFTSPTRKYLSDGNTLLLTHFDGSDGSTSFVDDSGGDESGNRRVVTYNGDAHIDASQSKFGGGSIFLGGVVGDNISIPDSDDWAFGTGDFTIDFWARSSQIYNTANMVYVQWVDINNRIQFGFNLGGGATVDSQAYLQLIVVSGGTILLSVSTPTSGGVLLSNTWHHIAMTRSSGTLKIFIDGVSQTLTYNNGDGSESIPNLAIALGIGGQTLGSFDFDGWLEELRVSNVARWTSNFIPPTRQYTDPSVQVITMM